MPKAIRLELIDTNEGKEYIDLNDILDILDEKDFYVIVFNDGSNTKVTKIKKSILTKFDKIKERRHQL